MALTFTPTDDPLVKLLDYCDSDPQRAVVKAMIDASGNQSEASRALDLCHSTIRRTLTRVKRNAAAKGFAPGHWTDGVAPGYRMGKVTVQRGPNGVERVWERQSPEAECLEVIIARCDERLKSFKRFDPRKAPAINPASMASKLANFIGIFDAHVGEKISSDDPAGRWDIETARRVIIGSVRHAVASAPKAGRIILCFGGDFMHYDGLLPVTPKGRHVLHSDGDFDDMTDAAIDIATACIDIALDAAPEVTLIWAEGNHDEASSVWMRKMLARLYERETRLTVVQSKVPYYAVRFGSTMIGVHHGHKAKLTRYAGIFANMFREMWGATKYGYGHRGHEHHIHEKEQDGMISVQHPSLAPSDDYAMGLGLVSKRGLLTVTYHEEYGEQSKTITRPEMLGLFEPSQFS